MINAGVVGLFLPSSALLLLDNDKIYSKVGNGVGGYKFNEDRLKDYCQIFVHLLSQVPEEKIAELYLNQQKS